MVAVVMAAILVSSSYAQNFPDSFEISRETFRPSPLVFNSPSSFRPVARGGRHYDFSSSGGRHSSASGAVLPSFPSNNFPSTFKSSFPSSSFSSSSHESHEFSSYASVPSSPSSSSFFSSPSHSFPSDPSSFPVITRASGVEILDVNGQDSLESLGLTLTSTLGFGPSGFTPAHIRHGQTRVTSPSRSYGPPSPKPKPPSLSQTYGPPPKLAPVTGYKAPSRLPTLPPNKPFAAYRPPSPTQGYGPPPTPTPLPPVFVSPSPFQFDSRSREIFTSSEFPHSSRELGFGSPETIFGTSVKKFPKATFPTRSFGGLDFLPLSLSGIRDSSNSREISVHPTTLKPRLSISFVSSEGLDSHEFFGSSEGGFFKPTAPARSFQLPTFGPLAPPDSHQDSSDELFLRTSKPRPVVTRPPAQAVSLKNARPPQTSFAGVGLWSNLPNPRYTYKSR